MDPVLVLAPTAAQVDPGGEARVRVTVRNDGELIEEYRFEVLGEAAGWTRVEPPEASVLPRGKETATVEVVFRPPPPPATAAGTLPFGVRCVSRERRDRCAVVEGEVSVGAVHDLEPVLDPVSPAGRWAGRYRARFANTGSVPVDLAVTATDPKRRLGTAVAPAELTVAPGETGTAYVSVRPRQPMLRGRPVPHGFTVGYRARGQDRGGELPGSFEQRPVLSRGVVAVTALLGLAAAAGVVLLARAGGDADPAPTAGGPPPPTTLASVERLTDSSVQLVWQASPYATGYVVQQVRPDDTVTGTRDITDRDQTATAWEGLKPGPACFRVVTVGTTGRSAPSEPRCVTLRPPAPAPATPAAPTPTPAEPDPTGGAPGGDPTSGPEPTPTGGSAGTPTGGPDGAPGGGPGGTPGGTELRGFVVIYASVPVDDQASQGVAQRTVSALQAAGSDARLIDSRSTAQLDDGAAGQWVVLDDGYPDLAAGRAECALRRSLAAGCYVQEPRTP